MAINSAVCADVCIQTRVPQRLDHSRIALWASSVARDRPRARGSLELSYTVRGHGSRVRVRARARGGSRVVRDGCPDREL